MDAQEYGAECSRTREIGILDERGLRDGDTVDALLLEDLRRRRLEQVVPNDVARNEPLRLLREQGAGAIRVLRVRGRLECIGESAQAADAELERLNQMLVGIAEMTRRVE